MLLLPLVVFFTSAVSGALGMGGGLILMGALALLLAPGPALLVHGAIQLLANGYRAWLLRAHVRWRIPLLQLASAIPTLAVAGWSGLVVGREAMLGLLGGVAVLGAVLSSPHRPRLPIPSAERTSGAVTSGALLSLTNVTAGVSGPLLDVFFIESRLDRYGVVGTKAVCASVGHVTKIAYVALLFPASDVSAVPPLVVLAAVPCVFLGTALGKRVLSLLGDRSFRDATRVCLGLIGAVYLARALLP